MQLDFITRFASILLFITILNACGGGSGNNSNSYILGGSISGLAGAGLILTDGTQTVAPDSGATSFRFPSALKSGTNYAVQVSASPGGLTCGVTHSTGTISGDVTTVVVICFPLGNTVLYSFAGGMDGAFPQGSLIQGSDGNFYGVTGTGGSANLGTVFKITPAGAETVLYSFTGGASDGASPQGSLVEGSDGSFYGMTAAGGSSNLGTVFKIAPDGAATVLHSFVGGASDGASPHDSLIQGSDSNFYGMTTAGGGSNLGTVFKIAPDGTETVLHSFVGGTSDGASPQGGLIESSDGNFYGMTHGGGSSSQGTVFKIAPDGTESVLYSFSSAALDGTFPRGSLIQGSDGFYGMTAIGGSLNLGTVFKITADGTKTLLHVFGSSVNDGISPYGSLIQGSDGNFYGMTHGGGSLNLGTVFMITPNGTETVLYSFAGGADGAAPQGNLIQGSDHYFYGMTSIGGGSQSLGTVFKLLP